jgi:hypothetical protein
MTLKGDEKAEHLRGILNAGFGRDRPYKRWDITSRSVQDCPTFAMAVLAEIGDMPDTIEDRAVIITMRRKAPGEGGSATSATSATAQVNDDDQVAGSGWDALPATPALPLTSEVAQVARAADPRQACAVCGQPMTAYEDGQTTHPWCDPGPPMTAAELAAAGFPAGLAEDTAP